MTTPANTRQSIPVETIVWSQLEDGLGYRVLSRRPEHPTPAYDECQAVIFALGKMVAHTIPREAWLWFTVPTLRGYYCCCHLAGAQRSDGRPKLNLHAAMLAAADLQRIPLHSPFTLFLSPLWDEETQLLAGATHAPVLPAAKKTKKKHWVTQPVDGRMQLQCPPETTLLACQQLVDEGRHNLLAPGQGFAFVHPERPGIFEQLDKFAAAYELQFTLVVEFQQTPSPGGTALSARDRSSNMALPARNLSHTDSLTTYDQAIAALSALPDKLYDALETERAGIESVGERLSELRLPHTRASLQRIRRDFDRHTGNLQLKLEGITVHQQRSLAAILDFVAQNRRLNRRAVPAPVDFMIHYEYRECPRCEKKPCHCQPRQHLEKQHAPETLIRDRIADFACTRSARSSATVAYIAGICRQLCELIERLQGGDDHAYGEIVSLRQRLHQELNKFAGDLKADARKFALLPPSTANRYYPTRTRHLLHRHRWVSFIVILFLLLAAGVFAMRLYSRVHHKRHATAHTQHHPTKPKPARNLTPPSFANPPGSNAGGKGDHTHE